MRFARLLIGIATPAAVVELAPDADVAAGEAGILAAIDALQALTRAAGAKPSRPRS